ncbi:DHA2 family efflux MFS transporter permease subunit [Kineococcus sp. T13]|nr:MFS transporter [Kineococcus vitellinus]NAZ74909.1 DHA2 family efflux MFS transporter permease subunit [Kineococcus vitellinus]
MPDGPRARVVVAVASLGFFLITLDISIVNVALTAIRDELGGGTAGQQWIIDGYTLLFAALLLFAGTLADRVGARRALLWGVLAFTATSAACAAAPGAGALVAARCAQGAAAAVMLPASMALVREAFPDVRRRARALGVWAVGGAVSAVVGQPLGGLLTTVDWRWIFTLNVPVGAGMVLLLLLVPPSPAHGAARRVPFDRAGQVLAVVALAALVHGLIDGGHAGFTSPAVLASLVLAVVALAAFVLVQARGRHPMLPLELFAARGVRLALPVGFAFMVGNYGHVFVVSLYLQQHLGLSPLRAGTVFVPAALFAVVGNLVSGPVTNRFGARLPVVGGQLSMAAGLLALVPATASGSPWWTALALVPVAVGGSLAMPPVTGVVLEGVPQHRAGTASAVFNTFRQIGGAVAIAVFGALIAVPGGFLAGARTSLVVAAALLLLTAVNSLRIPARTPR